MKKIFQECNWLLKMWRFRFYILIPFQYIWHYYLKKINFIETRINSRLGIRKDTENIYNPNKKELLSILIGKAQNKMGWIWTSEEVLNKIKTKIKKQN